MGFHFLRGSVVARRRTSKLKSIWLEVIILDHVAVKGAAVVIRLRCVQVRKDACRVQRLDYREPWMLLNRPHFPRLPQSKLRSGRACPNFRSDASSRRRLRLPTYLR